MQTPKILSRLITVSLILFFLLIITAFLGLSIGSTAGGFQEIWKQ